MYYCQMPDCDYMCESKSQIHSHHIIPKAQGGSNKRSNLIDVCPNCHNKIYVEGAQHGIHSIKHNNSIILIEKLLSTAGYVISYRYIDDDVDNVRYSLITNEVYNG